MMYLCQYGVRNYVCLLKMRNVAITWYAECCNHMWAQHTSCGCGFPVQHLFNNEVIYQNVVNEHMHFLDCIQRKCMGLQILSTHKGSFISSSQNHERSEFRPNINEPFGGNISMYRAKQAPKGAWVAPSVYVYIYIYIYMWHWDINL